MSRLSETRHTDAFEREHAIRSREILHGTYRPRSNAFWYGVICGICIATSAAMFMIVTRMLGIWS